MTTTGPRIFTRDDLTYFKPEHDAFVGIDSDGCVFDTMEAKQKRCFHGAIVKHWALEAIEAEVRETAEFVNLYSRWRGQNRFVTLLLTFELLAERPEVQQSGLALPSLAPLRNFTESGRPLGNPSLAELVEESGDPDLRALLAWSLDVNEQVAQLENIPPFPGVVESMDRVREQADIVCVSQTPTEALMREWEANNLLPYARVIAGQELGTKTEHLRMVTAGRYRPDRVLMIGDAPGDLAAARAVDALFYPIDPHNGADSWHRFHSEAFARFLAGAYAGSYQDERIAEFEALLPETPPWEKG